MANQNFDPFKVDRLTWPEYRDRLETNPTVFLPAGALEQHGPHLPMGCDAIFAEEIALRVAAEVNGLVLPPLSYGYKSQERSGGGQTFPGTTSLDGHTLVSMVSDIVRELARHGVARVVVLNGHVENQWFLTEGIDLALRELASASPGLKIVRCEYWNYTPQWVLDKVFDGNFPGVDLEHAALLETSMMLALYPERVRTGLIPRGPLAGFPGHDVYPQDGSHVPPNGVLAPAAGASAGKGRLLIDETVKALVGGLSAAFAAGPGCHRFD